MQFTVSQISEGETACNVTLDAIRPAGVPADEYAPTVACNSRFVQKVSA